MSESDLEPWRATVDQVALGCAPHGLDLTAPLRADWYNERVSPALAMPDLGRRDALVILIGNSRALWPPFVEALRRQPERAEWPNALDGYVMEQVAAVVASLSPATEIRWAHDEPPRRIAVQQMAEVAGLAVRAPSILSIHPVLGPWLAFRAAVAVDVTGPAERPVPPVKPCPDCELGCLPAFRAAVEGEGRSAAGSTWRRWLAVRDACPAGRGHRYSDDQVAYHYTKDRGILRRLARSAG